MGAKGSDRARAKAALAALGAALLLVGCSEEPLPQSPLRSDDCLREVNLGDLGQQLKRCNQVVAAFPKNPAPLNDRYLLRSLAGPDQEAAACADIRRAAALARQVPTGKLDPQLRTELALRLALCEKPVRRPLQLNPKG